MYTSYFGLREKPFQPDTRRRVDLFLAGPQAAFSMLEFGLLEQVGITVITGESGLVVNRSSATCSAASITARLTVGLIGTARKSCGTLLKWIINAFRIRETKQRRACCLPTLGFLMTSTPTASAPWSSSMKPEHGQQRPGIAAPAHQYPLDKNQLPGVILVVGQPSCSKSSTGRHEPAGQVSARHPQPLNLFRNHGYICYRVEQAGCARELFDVSSLLAIYYYSGGIPR